MLRQKNFFLIIFIHFLHMPMSKVYSNGISCFYDSMKKFLDCFYFHFPSTNYFKGLRIFCVIFVLFVVNSFLRRWQLLNFMTPKKHLLPLTTPGEILAEEFLVPMDLSEYQLAKSISVPPGRINEIIKGRRAITPDTAWRLSLFFGTTAQFWINLQTDYELFKIQREKTLPRIERFEMAVAA